jgi:hypothetical protein
MGVLGLDSPLSPLSEPYDNPFWQKSFPAGEKEERKGKNAANSEHLVL